MANRTLQFYGFAYGNTPVTLDVSINGQQVFSNTVSTIAGNVPVDINAIVCDQILFEIDSTSLFPVEFSGYYPHSVTVSGGSGVLLGDVFSNYMASFTINGPVNGTADSFHNVYKGAPTNSENTPDCRSSVIIDGVAQESVTGDSQGTWTWPINSGSTLSCNLNIGLGNIAI